MTNETQQLAQRLYDEGRLNMEEGLFCYGSPLSVWYKPRDYINFCMFERFAQGLDEAYAALAALDSSIPVWRDVRLEEPPKDKEIYVRGGQYTGDWFSGADYFTDGIVKWCNSYQKWYQSAYGYYEVEVTDFTHWTYPPAAPERIG